MYWNMLELVKIRLTHVVDLESFVHRTGNKMDFSLLLDREWHLITEQTDSPERVEDVGRFSARHLRGMSPQEGLQIFGQTPPFLFERPLVSLCWLLPRKHFLQLSALLQNQSPVHTVCGSQQVPSQVAWLPL